MLQVVLLSCLHSLSPGYRQNKSRGLRGLQVLFLDNWEEQTWLSEFGSDESQWSELFKNSHGLVECSQKYFYPPSEFELHLHIHSQGFLSNIQCYWLPLLIYVWFPLHHIIRGSYSRSTDHKYCGTGAWKSVFQGGPFGTELKVTSP